MKNLFNAYRKEIYYYGKRKDMWPFMQVINL